MKRIRRLLPDSSTVSNRNRDHVEPCIPINAKQSLEMIQHNWEHCDDLQTHSFRVQEKDIYILWLQALTNMEQIQQGIIAPLTQFDQPNLTTEIVVSVLSAIPVTLESEFSSINQAIGEGHAAVLIDGNPEAVIINVSEPPSLNIERPQNEPSVSGPQEAFTGKIDTDVGMVRKRLRSSNFKMESFKLGSQSHTSISLLYFDGIINPIYVETVKQRINRLHLDHVLSINYILEVIRDHRYSLFPTMEVTERPDKVVAGIVEGRFSILVDGSPQAILAPTTFLSILSSGEDYYQSFFISLLVRLLRQLGFWISMLLPAFYIAILSYNQDLIPTPLLINIAKQHTGIPFPTVIEMFLMVITFEMLREAGIRLPKSIGQSVSIVGTLVIGEAAVNAGIVSSGAVIIVALSGVASFTNPSIEMVNTTRILQFFFMLIASFLGVYGVVVTGLCLALHMVSIDSFGVPYMAPYAPFVIRDIKDSFIRAPWWTMTSRPQVFNTVNKKRNQMRTPK